MLQRAHGQPQLLCRRSHVPRNGQHPTRAQPTHVLALLCCTSPHRKGAAGTRSNNKPPRLCDHQPRQELMCRQALRQTGKHSTSAVQAALHCAGKHSASLDRSQCTGKHGARQASTPTMPGRQRSTVQASTPPVWTGVNAQASTAPDRQALQ